MRIRSARQAALDVYGAATGNVITSNVYLVRSGSAWVLIDTGWWNTADVIRRIAESVFGSSARPSAILLTHIHPDHSGSALSLARSWGVPVYLHPGELPMAGPHYPQQYMNPADRRLSAVVTHLLPARMQGRMRAEANHLRRVVHALDPEAEPPGLPGWRCIPTPGHTPGRLSFYRPSDRVLITGDAVLTVNPNSLPDLTSRRHRALRPTTLLHLELDQGDGVGRRARSPRAAGGAHRPRPADGRAGDGAAGVLR